MAKFRWSYSEAKKHANNIVKMRLARMRQLCADAGLDPTLLGIHPHNAMCAYHAGKPWKGVDYSLVRKILWMDRHLYDANRILDRYAARRTQENPLWIQADQGKFA